MFRRLVVCAMVGGLFVGNCSPSSAAPQKAAAIEHLPAASNSQNPMTEYGNTEYGISFKYPKAWQQQSKPDGKEAVVKFGGATGGLNGEVVLNRYGDDATPEIIKGYMSAFLSKLTDYKKVRETRVAIGSTRKLAADLTDVTFTVGELKVEQRYVLFDVKGTTFALLFTAPGAQFNSLTPVFNDILLSVRTGSGIASSTKGIVTKPVSNSSETSVSLQIYKSKNVPVSFGYPAGWNVTPGTHSDEAVSMQGTNSKGVHASIVLNKGETAVPVSIDDVADSLTKEYFEPLNSFHKVTRQNQNFGRMSKINGVVQEQTFEKDGATMKQMVAMFQHSGKTYALSLVAPGWKDSDMHHLFYKILATIDVQE